MAKGAKKQAGRKKGGKAAAAAAASSQPSQHDEVRAESPMLEDQTEQIEAKTAENGGKADSPAKEESDLPLKDDSDKQLGLSSQENQEEEEKKKPAKGAKKQAGRKKGKKAAAASPLPSQNDEVGAESPLQEDQAEQNEATKADNGGKADSPVKEESDLPLKDDSDKQLGSPSQENQEEEKKKKKPGRRGGKRGRATTKKDSNEHKEEQKEAPKAKRPRKTTSLPETETEYFEEKRNLEDLWKAAFPVGTEWDQLDALYEYNWDFSNLEEAFDEGGKLHGKKVYLFGCTEPQLVPFKEESKVLCVPAVVAVESPFPPSDKIGVNSVQREKEEIIPMKQMKMDWVPYIPLESRDRQVDRLKSQIFILGCVQRRAALKHMKEDRLKKFEYCLPYFYQPFKEDELEQSTEVQIIFPAEPNPVFCEFDWELDELEEFTDNMVEEGGLSEDQKDAFKEFVKENVRAAKRANREAREARKKAIEEMSEETKQAFHNMKFYKFYPVPTADSPDVSKVKSPFINRYYGKAHEVL